MNYESSALNIWRPVVFQSFGYGRFRSRLLQKRMAASPTALLAMSTFALVIPIPCIFRRH